eukprot:Gb_25756 [translate_table: standard]
MEMALRVNLYGAQDLGPSAYWVPSTKSDKTMALEVIASTVSNLSSCILNNMKYTIKHTRLAVHVEPHAFYTLGIDILVMQADILNFFFCTHHPYPSSSEHYRDLDGLSVFLPHPVQAKYVASACTTSLAGFHHIFWQLITDLASSIKDKEQEEFTVVWMALEIDEANRRLKEAGYVKIGFEVWRSRHTGGRFRKPCKFSV